MKLLISVVIASFLTVLQVLAQPNIPLDYKISLNKVRTKEKEIILDIKITNISKTKIIVDKNLIATPTFERGGEDQTDGGISNKEALTWNAGAATSLVETDNRYVILSPRESINEIITLTIDDDFFNEHKNFSVFLTYRQPKSVKFKNKNIWKGKFLSNRVEFSYIP